MAKGNRWGDPDAHVYRTEGNQVARLCAHCVTSRVFDLGDEGLAFRDAQLHLWSVHSIRRVWIDFSDPRFRSMVELALPLVIASNTTRHD